MMNSLIQWLPIIDRVIVVGLGIVSLSLISRYLRIRRRTLLYKRLPEIAYLLEHIKQVVYDKVYHDHIEPFFRGSYRLSNEDIRKILPHYIQLLYKHIGDDLLKDILTLYGNDIDAFNRIMANEFVKKIISDEQNNLMRALVENSESPDQLSTAYAATPPTATTQRSESEPVQPS